jgi:signal transduction histidine kinase
MQALLDDMVDYNRSRLGLGISIAPADIDLAQIFADELDQLRVVHQDREVDLDVFGDCAGVWDGRHLQQLLGNLVLNAIKYGWQDAPVQVTVVGRDEEVLPEVAMLLNAQPSIAFLVHYNEAQIIRAEMRAVVSRAIVSRARLPRPLHGEINARSDKAATVFSVHLPRGK